MASEIDSSNEASYAGKPAVAAEPRHFWIGLAGAAAIYVATRVIVLAVALLVPHHPASPAQALPGLPLIRHDACHYLYITEHGYRGLPADSDALAFFPGYPLAARLLLEWMPPQIALVVLSHAAGLVGVCFLFAWSRQHGGRRVAWWCVCALCTYPGAMFFSTGYADGLFFMAVAIALWLLNGGRLFSAAVVSGWGTLIRPTGLALAAVIGLWALIYPPRRPLRRACLAVLAGMVAVWGFVGFQAYLWHLYGRPDAFLSVQQKWDSQTPIEYPLAKTILLKPILQPLANPIKYCLRGEFSRLLDTRRVINPYLTLAILILAFAGLRRPGTVPRVFYLLPLLVFLSGYLPDPAHGGRLIGMVRYQLIALPCFLLLARWMVARWPSPARWGLLVGMMILQCLYMHWYAQLILVS